MVESPQVPDGCQAIPLYRNVSGTNFHLRYEIVGYTVVDDTDFQRLSQDRWFMAENYKGDNYAYRIERQGGKTISIQMAREILGLPCGAGRGGDEADHKDHNTLRNSRDNLRIATSAQSKANRMGWGSGRMPRGVYLTGNKYTAHIGFDRSDIKFIGVLTKIEAVIMRRHAAIILHDKFAYLQDLFEDEMPSRERRWELMGLVIEKLRQKGFLPV